MAGSDLEGQEAVASWRIISIAESEPDLSPARGDHAGCQVPIAAAPRRPVV